MAHDLFKDLAKRISFYIHCISPRGMLRLDRSEPDIELPLANLPVHDISDYHIGALDLNDLGNVSAASPNDNDVLKYVDASGNWQAAPMGSVFSLDDLSDVSAASPNNLDILSYDASLGVWIPRAEASGGAGTLDESYDWGGSGAGATIIADSGPVKITGDGLDAENILYTDGGELTIASGVIAPTKIFHSVDTESNAETDDVTAITAPTGDVARIVFIRLEHNDRHVVFKHNGSSGTGNNILLANSGDVELTEQWNVIAFRYDSELDSGNGAWMQLTTSTVSDALNAVRDYIGSLELKTKTLEIGDESNALGMLFMIKFGDAPDTYPILFCNSKEYTATTEQMIGVDGVTNTVFGINRNSNNKVSSWTMTKAQASTQVGIVRGAGDPNYFKSPVVLGVDDDEEYAAVAAYADKTMAGSGDNGFSIVDIREKENPVVVASLRYNDPSADDLYLDGCACVRIKGNYLYATCFFDCSLLIFNIQDRTDPVLVGGVRGSDLESISHEYYNGSAWVASGDTHFLAGASWVEIVEISGKKFAAVCSRKDGALTIYDVTDPAAVSLVDIDEHTNGGITTDFHELAGAICCTIIYHTSDAKYYIFTGTRWQGYTGGDGYGVNATNGWDNEWGTGERQGSVVCHELSSLGALTFKDEIHGKGATNHLSEVHGIRYHLDVGDYSHEYVYVACFGDDCVTIIDVSTKTALAYVTHFGSSGSPNYTYRVIEPHIVADGNGDAKYCYVATWGDNGFTIWDVENAGVATPSRVGGKAGTGYVGSPHYLEDSHSIWVTSDNYMLIVSRGGSNSFNIYSVESSLSFPSAPTGTLTDGDISNGNDLVINGNYAYIPSYSGNKLVKVDISNPASMSKTASASGGSLTGPSAVVIGYHSSDGKTYAIVACYSSDSIIYVDISDMSIDYTKTDATDLNGPYDLDVDDPSDFSRIYVACFDGNMLTVLDSSRNIINKVTGSGGTDGHYLAGARGIVYFGNGYVAVAAKTDNNLGIYGVSGVDSSNAPELIRNFQGTGAPNYMSGIEDVCIDAAEEYLYCATRTDDAVVQIDVQDPTSPFISGVITGATNKLDGAIRIRCCNIQGEEFIIVGSWDSGSIVVLKKSDFGRSNVVGIRNLQGTMQKRNAFGSWSAL